MRQSSSGLDVQSAGRTPAARRPPPAASPPASDARARVLAADDDPVALADLVRLLDRVGHLAAVPCRSEAELAAAIAAAPPDAVVAEVAAFGGRGLDLLAAARAADPEVAALAVTRPGDADAIAAARSRLGPLAVAPRPFDPAELLSRLRAGLDRRRLVGELAAARADLAAARAQLADRSRELGTATERLVDAEKLAAVGRVTSGLAHEISSQLALVGYAEAIRSRVARDPELTEFAEAIVAAQKRLVAMVDQMRRFAIGGRGGALDREPADVVAVVDGALAILRYDAGLRRRELIRRYRARPLCALDRDTFTQVVINLVSNAVLATAAGDPIAVEIDEDRAAAQLVLDVVDGGVGMAPEVVARLGEPFFTTRGERGSGLGVGICRQIVQEHGGSLTFDSAPGRGTRATVRLPLLPEAG